MTNTNDICRTVHEALEPLPAYSLPKDVAFRDGLYFFYENGESSTHAPNGRIVRVGNHPRRAGGLVQRLNNHYGGRKNGSAFRKLIGGALMRRERSDHACLAHWEKQDEKTCEICLPTEQLVSALLRQGFYMRCVSVPDMAERNSMEGYVVAALASCTTCQPSAQWLGRYAYSEKVRRSGLWNSQFVDDPVTDRWVDRFVELASLTRTIQTVG